MYPAWDFGTAPLSLGRDQHASKGRSSGDDRHARAVRGGRFERERRAARAGRQPAQRVRRLARPATGLQGRLGHRDLLPLRQPDGRCRVLPGAPRRHARGRRLRRVRGPQRPSARALQPRRPASGHRYRNGRRSADAGDELHDQRHEHQHHPDHDLRERVPGVPCALGGDQHGRDGPLQGLRRRRLLLRRQRPRHRHLHAGSAAVRRGHQRGHRRLGRLRRGAVHVAVVALPGARVRRHVQPGVGQDPGRGGERREPDARQHGRRPAGRQRGCGRVGPVRRRHRPGQQRDGDFRARRAQRGAVDAAAGPTQRGLAQGRADQLHRHRGRHGGRALRGQDAALHDHRGEPDQRAGDARTRPAARS